MYKEDEHDSGFDGKKAQKDTDDKKQNIVSVLYVGNSDSSFLCVLDIYQFQFNTARVSNGTRGMDAE